MIAAEPKTTGQYQPYPEYKNTGLTWLGAIPNHWELKRAKFVFKRVQRPVRVEDDIVTAFRDGQVTLRSNRRTEGFTNALQEIGYQGVRSGDLLIHAMDGFAGAIGISDSEGKCSPVCSVCIPISAESVNPYYYGYLVRQLAVTGFITSLSKGIRERSTEFRFSEFSPLELTLPPVDEQHIIAAFLDYETARIDRLIAQQQRLIELLKEKRQAVISHAVTKGLNPDVPMKDSGVEWLGQVPEHWSVVKLSYVLSLKSGDGITSNEIEPEGTYPVYGGNGLRGYCEQFNCNGTYALIGRQGALCGNVNVADGKFFASEHAVVVYPRIQFDVRFLSEFLRFMDLGQYSVSAAQPGISVERINMLSIAVPPIEEQSLIGQRISQVELQIERLVVKAEAGVLLLKERRTALISAAVTGKIDLRGWIPPAEEAAA